MTAYYNEIDPYAAEWLRNLMRAGHIAPGDIDTRSIEDVHPEDLRGYTQCHFFAGIGVWSYALRQAGWPDDRPVWTGSCPCQPFSAAGKRKGTADERHLWPAFHHLIRECRPAMVFGEQVASPDGLAWLDLVCADLEGEGYAVAAADLCAAGVGAPHIRQRLYWVAYSNDAGLEGRRRAEERAIERAVGAGGVAGGLADADGRQLAGQSILRGVERDGQNARRPEGSGSAPACRDHGGLADAESERWNGRESSSWAARRDCFEDSGDIDWLADATEFGRREECSDVGRGAVGNSAEGLAAGLVAGGRDLRPSPTNGHWRAADWLRCRDGRWRPVEPGYEQMADGSASSLGRLCANSVAEIEEEINAWSIRHQADARKAMRSLWEALQQEALCERQAGRFSGVQSPPILLAFLRQLTEQGWRFADALACSCTEASRAVLRIMRFDAEAPCTPLRRELAEQFGGELADALRELSSIVAHHAKKCWGEAGRQKAAAASFPLTDAAVSRVGRLRAYGNAIVPQVASTFVRAVMEAMP